MVLPSKICLKLRFRADFLAVQGELASGNFATSAFAHVSMKRFALRSGSVTSCHLMIAVARPAAGPTPRCEAARRRRAFWRRPSVEYLEWEERGEEGGAG